MIFEGTSAVSDVRLSQYGQVCEFSRFYSNIRFLLLPVFAVATGGIFLAVFSKDLRPEAQVTTMIVKLFGVYFGVAFLVLEIVLNKYITEYARIALEMESSGGGTWFGVRQRIADRIPHRRLVPITMYLTYILVAGFWLSQIEWLDLQFAFDYLQRLISRVSKT